MTALEVAAIVHDLTTARAPNGCFVRDLIRCLSPIEDFSYFLQYRDVPVLGPAFVALASCIEQVRSIQSADLTVLQYRDSLHRALVQRFTEPSCNYRMAQQPQAAVWQGNLSVNQCPINTPLAYMAVAAILVRAPIARGLLITIVRILALVRITHGGLPLLIVVPISLLWDRHRWTQQRRLRIDC
jgi:hypothetical protein